MTIIASLNVSLQPQDDTAPRLAVQEEYEQQLHQLSLHHILQAQIATCTEQTTQLQQHVDQRQATLAPEPGRHGLVLPPEGETPLRLSKQANEVQMQQQRQNELTETQARVAQLASLLGTPSESETFSEVTEDLSLENWQQVHDDCLSLQGQWQTLQQQEAQDIQHAADIQAQFDAAPQTSIFDDRNAFTAALLDEETFNRFELLKQSLENQQQQTQALLNQTQQALVTHQQQQPIGVDLTLVAQHLRDTPAQLTQLLRDNTARQGEIRQQLRQDVGNCQQQQVLMQEIEKVTQQVEDWGYLNAPVGSKEGDKFRKFTQGLALDNLVWLTNSQLTRLHGRCLSQCKASEALELEMVDAWQTDTMRDTRIPSGDESFLMSLALAPVSSDLVSYKTRIDSLFLDEGFGALDSETLDIALDTLDTPNVSGKVIDVISHAEVMKEHVPV